MDRKRPPTFSVDGLTHGMGFSDFARERSAPADCFRCKVRWDRRASVARCAAPCTERSDARQPGQSTVRAISSAGRTYSRQESIEVRPCYQGIFITHTVLPHIVSQILLGSGHRSEFAAPQRCRQSERTASEVPHPTNETGMIRNVIGRRTPIVCSSVRVKPTQKISFVIAIAPPCLSVESPYDSGRVSAFSVARRCAWG